MKNNSSIMQSTGILRIQTLARKNYNESVSRNLLDNGRNIDLGDVNPDSRAFAFFALDLHLPAVGQDDMLYDRKTEAGAAEFP